MESGDITVARGEEMVILPARSIAVMASNPCPCGNAGLAAGNCKCRPPELRDYERRVRGPLMDRIDITVKLNPVTAGDAALAAVEPSALIRERVRAARSRQAQRYQGRQWRLNAHAPGVWLRREWPLLPEAQYEVDVAVMNGHLSRRGAVRVHRLAWTVADLGGADQPGIEEVQAAINLRTGGAVSDRILLRRAG